MDHVDGALVVEDHVPLGELSLRIGWMTVQLILVIYLGQQGALFFYQQF